MDVLVLHRRAPVRALGLALAVALLATLLVPLASPLNGAVAAADEAAATTETDPATQDSGGEETPIASETPVTEETPVVEETPVSDGNTDAALTAGANSRIVIWTRECATDYGADFFQFDAKCPLATNAPFELSGFDLNGTYVYKTATNFLDIYVAGGSYTVHEDIPQGYRVAAVFCTKGTTAVPYTEFVSYEGYLEFSLTANEHIGCHFFNVAKNAPVSYGALQLEFSVCPPVEAIPFPFDYATADVGQLATVCSLYRDAPVPFNLLAATDGFDLTMYTNPNNNAIASWAQMAAGSVRLTTEPWAGYSSPRVFCYYDNAPTKIFEATVQGWDATFTLSSSVWAVCSWFNIPAPSPQPSGTVAVTAYLCDGVLDQGIDPYGATRDELLAACEPYAGEDLGFDLTHGATDEPRTGYTVGTGDGAAYWEGIPGGDLTIAQIAGSDGYGEPVVVCSVTDPRALVFNPVYSSVQVQNLAVSVDLPEGASLSCDWFSIPEDDGASVTVITFVCPTTTDEDDYDWFAETCTEAVEGVSFKLDGESSGNPGDFPTDANGRVRWGGLEADTFYLYEEQLPAGYGQPAVFCGTGGHFDDYEPRHTPGADPFAYRVELDVDENDRFECYWFNIPTSQNSQELADQTGDEDGGEVDGQDVAKDGQEDGGPGGAEDGGDGAGAQDGGAVIVYAWTCPASDVQDPTLTELYETCQPAAETVTFHLIDGQGNDTARRSDERSRVQWGDVAAGNYGVRVELPAGYGAPVVYCDLVEGAENWMPERWAVTDGTIAFAHQGAGWDVVCDWFNVPATAGNGGADKTATGKHGCGVDYLAALSCAGEAGDQGTTPRRADGQTTGAMVAIAGSDRPLLVAAPSLDLTNPTIRWAA